VPHIINLRFSAANEFVLTLAKKDFVENELRKGDSEGVSKVILSEWLDM
jgi:hypothetical protein